MSAGAGEMLMNGRIKIDERDPTEWTLLIGLGSDLYVPWDRIGDRECCEQRSGVVWCLF